MPRISKLVHAESHLEAMQLVWQADIACIKDSWWYQQLSPGPKRFLTYRFQLIQYIIDSASRIDATVYRYGADGLAFIYDWDGQWWLGGVSVRPSLLKDISGKPSGIGEKLILHICKDAKRNNIPSVSCHPGASGLHKYYKRLGFEPSGVRKHIGVVFTKELA